MSVPLRSARPLPEILDQLRDKGLRRGVGPMPGTPSAPAVPSGQPALDDALRTGGWPRGSLAFLDAKPGSGAATLALGSLAAAQERGGIVAWIDGDGSFDPATAQRLGVRLEWLLLVRPASGPSPGSCCVPLPSASSKTRPEITPGRAKVVWTTKVCTSMPPRASRTWTVIG